MSTIIHPTADVSPAAILGDDVRVWHQVHIRERARIGDGCIIGKGSYVDFDVAIGRNCKIQNGCFVYHGATLEDGVFLGPGVILTNDMRPRAINPDGSRKGTEDWVVGRILIRRGAAVGAGAIVLPNVTIGEFALVGAGALVTRDVPAYTQVVGSPARAVAEVDAAGAIVRRLP